MDKINKGNYTLLCAMEFFASLTPIISLYQHALKAVISTDHFYNLQASVGIDQI